MANFRSRSRLALAVAAIAVIAGANGVKAQDQTGMFADEDGLTPPDMGAAYEIPVRKVAAAPEYPLWPELVALLADPDGMNAPNTGFAYVLPVQRKQLLTGSVTGLEAAATR